MSDSFLLGVLLGFIPSTIACILLYRRCPKWIRLPRGDK